MRLNIFKHLPFLLSPVSPCDIKRKKVWQITSSCHALWVSVPHKELKFRSAVPVGHRYWVKVSILPNRYKCMLTG